MLLNLLLLVIITSLVAYIASHGCCVRRGEAGLRIDRLLRLADGLAHRHCCV
jgi:hypothetical protein